MVDRHRPGRLLQLRKDREALGRGELARPVIGGDRSPPAGTEARGWGTAALPLRGLAEDVPERHAVLVERSRGQDGLGEGQLWPSLGREQRDQRELVRDRRVQEIRGRPRLTGRTGRTPVKRREHRLGAPGSEDRQEFGADEPRGLADDVAVVVARLGRDADVLTGEVGAERAVDENRVGTGLGRRQEDMEAAPGERELIGSRLRRSDRDLGQLDALPRRA